jgi:hypothetical protein
MPRRIFVCLVVLLCAVPAFSLSTKSAGEGLTPEEIAALLTGPGATISNVKITGADSAIGSFADGAALGMDQGLVMSTGNISAVVGPNSSTQSGVGLGAAGHEALDAVVAPYKTFDAVVLEFDVVTVSPTFAIRYVFASEEYREWVGSEFNDVFGFFVNGSNIALTPGSADPVTVNTINHLVNTGMYRDNEGGAATQFDGYTAPLLAVAVVEPNVQHHIRIAIADASDAILDSAVFISQGGISGSQIAPIIIPSMNAIDVLHGEELEVTLPIYYAFENLPPTLSVSGVPGVTATFSPIYEGQPGRFYTDMHLTIGPDTPSGSHTLTIHSAVPGAESTATLILVVECRPPAILGTGQPVTQTVNRGTQATLHVEPFGSAPFSYQWFQGYTGMTSMPRGINSAQLMTSPVFGLTPYWVRVSNACGTYDSLTAFAVPK